MNFHRIFRSLVSCRNCIFLYGGAAAILGALTGCGDDRELRATLASLNEELARKRAEAAEMESHLNNLRKLTERTEAENAAFTQLNAGFRGEFGYADGQPRLSGVFRNDLGDPLSSLRVEVAFKQARQILRRELLEIVFDPIVLGGQERRATAAASPQTWGFRQIEDGDYEFIVYEATQSNGRILRNDVSKLNEQRSRLARLENNFREKRLRIGELVTRIGDLEEALR